MCDDDVEASPVNKKKLRRRRRSDKSSEKHSGSDDSNNFEITASTSKTFSEMSTTTKESCAGVTPGGVFDISALYGNQESLEEADVTHIWEGRNLFAYEMLLEKHAFDMPPSRRICPRARAEAKQGLIRASDHPELQEETCQINAANEPHLNASVVSDTLVLKLCEAGKEGFDNSEIESLQSESSNKSKDISSFLDDDNDEYFKDLGDTCLAENINQGDAEIARLSGEALSGVNHLKRVTGGAVDNPIVNELNDLEENIEVRTSCWNKDNNCAILNRDIYCLEQGVSSHLSKDVDVCPKSKDISPGSPRESQIWPDENLLCELSMPFVDSNVTTKSVTEFDNSRTDENENNTKFIRSDLSSIRSNLNKNKGFSGITSASGEPILVLKEAREKASKILSDVDDLIRDEFEQDPIKGFEKKIDGTGFNSASGKPFLISEEAMNKAGNLFVENGTKENPVKSLDKKIIAGFKKVTGKSTTSNRTPALQDNLKRDETDQNLMEGFKENTGLTGFKLASGKILTISKEATNRANNLFAEVDDLTREKITQDSEQRKVESFSNTPFSKIEMSSDYKISEEFKTTSNQFQPGFESYSNRLDSEKSELKGTMTGFTMASGKSLEISSKGKTIANKFLSELNSWNEKDLLKNVKVEELKTMKSSPEPTIDKIKSENQRMYNRFNEKENYTQTTSSSEKGIIRRESSPFTKGNSKMRLLGLCAPRRSIISTNLSNEKPTKRLKPNNYLPIPVKMSTNRRDVAFTRSNPQKIYDTPQKSSICENFVSPLKTQSVFQQCDTPELKESFNSVKTSTPQAIKRMNNISLAQEISASISALVEDELKSSAVGDDFHTIKWDDFEDSFNDES